MISHPPLPILSFGSGLSLPFGILKTIQMNGRQFILGHSAFRLMPFLRALRSVSFTSFDAIDLGLKPPLSFQLAP